VQIVVAGVAGSGKTTVGRRLAAELGWAFVEGDDLHPPENVRKMRRGVPLTAADREPWLAALAGRLDELDAGAKSAVVACSALGRSFRRRLATGRPGLRLVWLDADPALLARRLRARRGHFFGPDLLASQIGAVEPPVHALRVDAARTPADIVAAIRRALGV